jgi:hypothetical protein
MKTALCFSGTGRSIEYTFDNLRENLIDNLDDFVDVFVYVAETPKAALTEKYFSDFSNNIAVVKEEYTNPSGSGYVFENSWPPRSNLEKGRDVYLKMIRSRKYLMDMVDSTDIIYDRVIFSRMDVVYENKIMENIKDLDMNYLWIPSFHHWRGGYNDRFAISNQDIMRTYMSQADCMEEYKNEGFVFHAERALKHHLERHNISPKIFNCNFARVRGDGKQCETFESIQEQRWKRPCDI